MAGVEATYYSTVPETDFARPAGKGNIAIEQRDRPSGGVGQTLFKSPSWSPSLALSSIPSALPSAAGAEALAWALAVQRQIAERK